MSICHSGIGDSIQEGVVAIMISGKHPLVRLANALAWDELAQIVLPDLQKSTQHKKWWVGRPLQLRSHLGAYVLQQLLNKTDRQMEADIKDNAAYQLFCGRGNVEKWHCPDHTKIEAFRSRITTKSSQELANKVAVSAKGFGFARAQEFDVDSTVQEANISYPSDVHLLGKLALKAKRVRDTLMKGVEGLCLPEVDLKGVKAKVRDCFFKAKKAGKEAKRRLQCSLWRKTCEETRRIIEWCETLGKGVTHGNWAVNRAIKELAADGRRVLLETAHFFRNGVALKGKILSLHVKAVSCFNKGKLSGRLEFGRNYQLGRIGGNYLIIKEAENVREEDKEAVGSMIALHERLFGEGVLKSFAADKGYYSARNKKLLEKKKLENGLQKPNHCAKSVPAPGEVSVALVNRRAGIEPLIGHAKHGGQLGKSRMKSDKATEKAAYSAVFGFNLRQLMHHQAKAALMQG
jgi:hypothetical protein